MGEMNGQQSLESKIYDNDNDYENTNIYLLL